MPDRNMVFRAIKQYFEDHGSDVMAHVAMADPQDLDNLYQGAMLGGLCNIRANLLEMPTDGGLLQANHLDEKGNLIGGIGLVPEALQGPERTDNCLLFAYDNFVAPPGIGQMRCAVLITPCPARAKDADGATEYVIYQAIQRYFEEHDHRVDVNMVMLNMQDPRPIPLSQREMAGSILINAANKVVLNKGILEVFHQDTEGNYTAGISLAPDTMSAPFNPDTDSLAFWYGNFQPYPDSAQFRCLVMFLPNSGAK